MDLTLAAATTGRLRRALDESPYDCLVLGQPANLAYATGYRSVGADIMHGYRMAAFVGSTDVVVGPVADAAAAAEADLDGDRFVGYGRFFFESADGSHAAASQSGRHADFDAAFAEAARRASSRGRVGVDGDALGELVAALPQIDEVVDVSSWMYGVRACKTAPEIEGEDIEGVAFKLSDYRGKVVMLDFWGDW